jgi:uncharacterized HAD superfamily protein
MVIAIDLDGCVFDTEEYYRTYAQLWDIALVGNGLQNAEEMHVHKRFGWNQETANQFYEKYTAQVLETAPIKPGAKYVLDQLKKQGHKLVCITLRGYYRECEISITDKRLQDAGISFEKIVYNQKNKLQACLDEKVDVIVDDNPDTMLLLSENNIKCLHFRGAGLRKVSHDNVIEVQNWADVLEKINDLK